MTGRTVMIVDDSLLASRKLSRMLSDLGYEVLKTCLDGAEAVAHYPDVKPDIVTMDITMPDLDGIAATRALLALDAQARIVVVTSHGQERMVLDALKAGARGYVMKPFGPDQLGAALRDALTRG